MFPLKHRVNFFLDLGENSLLDEEALPIKSF